MAHYGSLGVIPRNSNTDYEMKYTFSENKTIQIHSSPFRKGRYKKIVLDVDICLQTFPPVAK